MSLHKNERAGGEGSTPIRTTTSTNVEVTDLYASNLSISSDNLDLIVTKSGRIVIELLLTGIVGWNVYQDVTLLIITDNQDPVALTFVNETEIDDAITIIETGMYL